MSIPLRTINSINAVNAARSAANNNNNKQDIPEDAATLIICASAIMIALFIGMLIITIPQMIQMMNNYNKLMSLIGQRVVF